jgi:hypothetical protein
MTNEEKELKRLYLKLWREKNKDKVKIHNKKYQSQNKEKIKEWKTNYDKSRYSIKKEYDKKYIKERRKIDYLYRLKNNIRSSINNSINEGKYTKKSRTHEILGCSYEDFKIYLESKFESWMNWDNYGNPADGLIELNKSWDIDHIIPLSSAKNEQELLELNHYTNLQPLCSYTNRFIKKDKM